MTRLILASVCAVLLAAWGTKANAQDFSAGLKVGVARSTLKVQGVPAFEPKAETVLSAGGFLVIDVGRILRIQPELLIVNRRFESVSSFPVITATAKTYEVPILVGARIPTGRRVEPTLFVGPYFSRVTRVRQEAAGTTIDISDTVDDLDAGVTFGLGLDVAMPRGAFVMDIRANFGVKNLAPSNALLFRSRGMAAHLGLRF